MQNVNTMIRRPVPFGSAVATGLLAFAAGAVIAIGAPVAITGLSTSEHSNASVSVQAVGAEQVAHSRSESGLVVTASAPGEQIRHARSEEGFARP